MVVIIYFILSYMAINKVWYSRRTYIVRNTMLFYMEKMIFAFVLGWILIPIAIIMLLFGK